MNAYVIQDTLWRELIVFYVILHARIVTEVPTLVNHVLMYINWYNMINAYVNLGILCLDFYVNSVLFHVLNV